MIMLIFVKRRELWHCPRVREVLGCVCVVSHCSKWCVWWNTWFELMRRFMQPDERSSFFSAVWHMQALRFKHGIIHLLAGIIIWAKAVLGFPCVVQHGVLGFKWLLFPAVMDRGCVNVSVCLRCSGTESPSRRVATARGGG